MAAGPAAALEAPVAAAAEEMVAADRAEVSRLRELVARGLVSGAAEADRGGRREEASFPWS